MVPMHFDHFSNCSLANVAQMSRIIIIPCEFCNSKSPNPMQETLTKSLAILKVENKCRVCNKLFKSKGSLASHKYKYHKLQRTKVSQEERADVELDTVDTVRLLE